MARPSSLAKQDEWKIDTSWTTTLSPKSSPLRSKTPGQNKLGQLLGPFMIQHPRDHDYL